MTVIEKLKVKDEVASAEDLIEKTAGRQDATSITFDQLYEVMKPQAASKKVARP